MAAVNPLDPVSSALNRLNVRFAVVGSVASSARGVVRATRAIDMVVRMGIAQAEKLAAALGPGWYADPQQIRDALAMGRSFNLIHLPSGWKIDMFPASTEFHDSELQRATPEPLTFEGEVFVCPVSTAEDILLAKLRWYRDGGEVSDRQWSDITGLLRVNPDIDRAYLSEWAARLRVTDLLDKALAQTAA